MHAAIGAYAKQKGITHFLTFGDLSAKAAQEFGTNSQHFTTLEALIAAIRALMKKETTVLVKGSRFMQMERVVKELLAKEIVLNQLGEKNNAREKN